MAIKASNIFKAEVLFGKEELDMVDCGREYPKDY
jgi:hypothetical protein